MFLDFFSYSKFKVIISIKKIHRKIAFLAIINVNLNRLAEVGKLQLVKPDNYATGQLFLHKVFGYRGKRVILHNSRANQILIQIWNF